MLSKIFSPNITCIEVLFSVFRVSAIIRHDSKCAVLDIENIEEFGQQDIARCFVHQPLNRLCILKLLLHNQIFFDKFHMSNVF